MSSWARAGVKCVCVDATPLYGDDKEIYPVEGQTYTVRSVEGGGVTLQEVRNIPRLYSDGFGEVLFRISRFRPLVTRTQQQDVAMFSHLLTGAPVMEPV